jgi:hypothetical protein
MRNEAIEAIGPGGLCLRVEFIWRGDRYRHLISVVDVNGQTTPLLESVEGTPSDDWPPSPPLQSLSIAKLSDGRHAALLVGMAGGSHWSASVEPMPGEAELLFDLACRHSKPPARLGSRYRRLSDGPEKATIRGEEARVTQEGEMVVVVPAVVTAAEGTARWKFAVRLASTVY